MNKNNLQRTLSGETLKKTFDDDPLNLSRSLDSLKKEDELPEVQIYFLKFSIDS